MIFVFANLCSKTGVEKINTEFTELILNEENSFSSFLSLFHTTFIFLFDTKGSFTFGYSNSETDLFYKPEQILKKSTFKLFPEDILEMFQKAFTQNKNKKPSVFTYSLSIMNTTIYYEANCSPLYKQGKFDGSLAVVRDITLEKTNQKNIKNRKIILEKMEKEKTKKQEQYKSNCENLLIKKTKQLKETIDLLKNEIKAKTLAEKETEHLKQILNTIKNIKVLIKQASDTQKFINDICLTLIKTNDYNSANIILVKNKKIYLTATQSKTNAAFIKKKTEPSIANNSLAILLSSREPIISGKDVSNTIISYKLENTGEKFGALSIELSSSIIPDIEELNLLKEICQDIAFALSNINHKHAQKEAIIALNESGYRYRALFENSGVGILFMENDVILEANQKIANIFRATIHEIKGMHPYDLSPETQPDGQKSIIKAKMYINTAISGTPQQFTWIHLRANGEEFPAEVILNAVTIGKHTFIHAIVKDITIRDNAEKALKLSEANYRTLTNNVPICLFRSNPNNGGTLLSVNPAMITTFGYDTQEELLMKKSISLFLDPNARSAFLAILNRDKLIENFETQMSKKDGTSFWASISARFVPDDANKSTYLIDGIISDISARKAQKEHIQETMTILNKAIDGTVTAMSKLVELKDPYTAGHQKGVAHLACAIGLEMNLTPAQIDCIRISSILHDLGKFNIPLEILNKPGPLTNLEMNFIKSHPEAGYNILKEIKFPWPIAETILQHHEKYDGSGYPNGLKKGSIRIEAAIVGVADIVEAIASKRPYRASKGISVALSVIEEGAGSLYDSRVVKACLTLFRKKKFKLIDHELLTNKSNFEF